MPLTLYVDGPRWRAHLRRTVEATPGLIPVAKGNGYGFTVGNLARRVAWLGLDMVAVGTYAEIRQVETRFGGDILVLEPWRPFLPDLRHAERIIHTIGRAEDLAGVRAAATGSPRVVLEGLTSMRRHGFGADELARLAREARGVRVEGQALHLPLGSGHQAEVAHWLGEAPTRRWFVSHLSATELETLRAAHPDVVFRPRLGTDLWLGDRAALAPRATVLDVHRVSRGDRSGYRQRRALRDGAVLVVAGGTAHGIGLEAPTSASTIRQRAVSLARGGLDAAGHALSPYVVDGSQRWLVEPPHMQVSMIFVPDGVPLPDIGDELEVQVRFTTTRFDRVVIA